MFSIKPFYLDILNSISKNITTKEIENYIVNNQLLKEFATVDIKDNFFTIIPFKKEDSGKIFNTISAMQFFSDLSLNGNVISMKADLSNSVNISSRKEYLKYIPHLFEVRLRQDRSKLLDDYKSKDSNMDNMRKYKLTLDKSYKDTIDKYNKAFINRIKAL